MHKQHILKTKVQVLPNIYIHHYCVRQEIIQFVGIFFLGQFKTKTGWTEVLWNAYLNIISFIKIGVPIMHSYCLPPSAWIGKSVISCKSINIKDSMLWMNWTSSVPKSVLRSELDKDSTSNRKLPLTNHVPQREILMVDDS